MMSLKNMIRGTATHVPAKQLIQLWEHDTGTLKFWRASSNFIYSFERGGARHFLRFIHEEDNTIGNIEAELDFVQYLIARGYPAAAPVRSKSGRLAETILLEEGHYYGVVFEQARGVHLPLEQMTDRQAEQWGRSLGSLHLLSEAYTSGAEPRGSWADALVFVATVLQRHPHEQAARHELDRLHRRLSALPADAARFGMIHYDFETDNVFYEADESRYYAIDFDDAMMHWYAMDIASAVSDLTERGDDDARRKIGHFLAGYRTAKPLVEHDVSLLPLFQRFAELYRFARLLRSVEGMDAASSPEWAVQLRDKLLRVCERIRGDYHRE